jgi:hypothetical protein
MAWQPPVFKEGEVRAIIPSMAAAAAAMRDQDAAGRPTVGKPIHAVAIVIALLAAPLARADECGDAVLNYNFYLPRLNDAIQRFSTCVADSLGKDRCAKEFAALQAAYKDFASAVSYYKKNCL